MPKKTWIEIVDNDIPAIERWFKECSRRDIPMIYIETRRKYGKLTWDCITVQSKRIDASFHRHNGEDFWQLLFRKFQDAAKADSGRPEFHGKASVGTIDRLELETARAIAAEYSSLLCQQLERTALPRVE